MPSDNPLTAIYTDSMVAHPFGHVENKCYYVVAVGLVKPRQRIHVTCHLCLTYVYVSGHNPPVADQDLTQPRKSTLIAWYMVAHPLGWEEIHDYSDLH